MSVGGARYSHLKAFKFPDRIAAIKHGRVAPPVHVQMILSDLCNQDCHFCAFRDPSYTSSQLFHVEHNYNPNRMLPIEKVIEVLDDCVEMGVRAVQLTGGGEPTIYPDFDRVIAALAKRKLQWAIVTNGVRQRDISAATWIRVSLDAATPETYARIRRTPLAAFDKACKTIELHKAGVGFVVTQENWHEIVDATRLARSLGASNIRIGAQFTADGADLFDGIREQAAALAEDATRLTTDSFIVHNRFNEKLADLDDNKPNYSLCGYQHFTTFIGGDQNLYRCCVYAYNPHGLLGSIKDRRFRDVWYEAAATFKGFDARGCDRCQFNSINRNIIDVVTSDQSEAFV